MTSSAAPARRLVLVPSAASRSSSRPDARIRRYRIARVSPEGRRPRPAGAVEPGRALA